MMIRINDLIVLVWKKRCLNMTPFMQAARVFLFILVIGHPLDLRAQGAWPEPPRLAAAAWILVDATTGQTLAAQNPQRDIHPASLTKLMTAYLTFSALRERKIRLEQTVSSPKESEIPQGSRMFLQADKDASVAELLSGLAVLGAHDAAIALAKAIAGTEILFVDQMNKTALRLGMSQTHFTNATGIADPGHKTTVSDLVKLTAQLVNEFPEYLREFNKRELTYSGIRQVNRNRLLWLDNSVDGLMTGRSESEGFNLAISAHRPSPIGSAERVQRRLLAIVAGVDTEEARAQEGLKLLNFGFQQFDLVRLFQANEFDDAIPVFKGASGTARLQFSSDVLVAVPRGTTQEIRTQLVRPNALLAPITAGQSIGQLRIWLGNREIHHVPVVAVDTVQPAGVLGRAIDAARLWWKSL
jgi:serine-type D-Ala-D-Ala carboxypeptidase (penicillin-binding protein 5/6)